MKNHLFVQLLWPAAAGNIAWAVFTLAIDDCHYSDPSFLARLGVLLLVAFYVGANWWRYRDEDKNPGRWFWIADAFHLAAVVVFVLATAADKDWLEWSLGLVLGITTFGHAINIWRGTDKQNWYLAWMLAGANASGLVVLILFSGSLGKFTLLNLPCAVFSVLVFWISLRFPKWQPKWLEELIEKGEKSAAAAAKRKSQRRSPTASDARGKSD